MIHLSKGEQSIWCNNFPGINADSSSNIKQVTCKRCQKIKSAFDKRKAGK